MARSAEHRSNFAAIHRQWWRLHMREKFSSGTKNSKQTNIFRVIRILLRLQMNEKFSSGTKNSKHFDEIIHLSINKRDGILKFMP